MVEVRSKSLLLLAFLTATLGSLISGCNHLPASSDDEESNELAADLPPETSSVDEADIGTFGPAQVEDAIETLDAQTEEDPSP